MSPPPSTQKDSSEKKDPKESKKDAKPAGAEKKEITIQLPTTLSFDFGPQFQFKLIILGLLLFLFLFSLFLFARASFNTSDLFNIARLQYNLPKLYSISFILFTLSFSLCMALAVYYGSGMRRMQSALPIVALVFLAFIASAFDGAYTYAFLGFALSIGAASIVASFSSELNFSTAWAATSKALMILLILSLLFTYAKVNANKDYYFDVFLAGVSGTVPQIAESVLPDLGKQGLAACANALDQVTITKDMVKTTFSVDNTTAALATAGGPQFTSLPTATQQAIAGAVYDACAGQAAFSANEIKAEVSKGLRSVDTSALIKNANVTSSLVSPALLKNTFTSIPEFKLMMDAFPMLAAVSVLSIVSVFNFVVHVLAALFAWGLAKLL